MDGVWVQEQESLGMVETEALGGREGWGQWLWEEGAEQEGEKGLQL